MLRKLNLKFVDVCIVSNHNYKEAYVLFFMYILILQNYVEEAMCLFFTFILSTIL